MPGRPGVPAPYPEPLPRYHRGVRAAPRLLAISLLGLLATRTAETDDAPAVAPRSAKAEYAWRMAEGERLRPILRRLDDLRQAGRFSAVVEAGEEALARFPDEQAVLLVSQLASRLPSYDPISVDAGVGRAHGWAQDLALRALERLPTPPDVPVHGALVGCLGVDRDAAGTPIASSARESLRQRAATAIVAYGRHLLDAIDPTWDPTVEIGHYAPRRASEGLQSFDGPVIAGTEEEFLRAQEAYYAAALRADEQHELRDLRDTHFVWLLRLADMYSWAPAADDELRRVTEPLAEYDLQELVRAGRRESANPANLGPVGGIRFELVQPDGTAYSGHAPVGRPLTLVLRAWNTTKSPIPVPLRCARVAFLHGSARALDSELAPPRAWRSDDLVVVAPGAGADVVLEVPAPIRGLSRIAVQLDNDVARVGDLAGVWTGSVHLEARVEISEPELRGNRGGYSLTTPQSIAGLGQALPDARSVRALRLFVAGTTDASLAVAALDELRTALERGYGLDSVFALLPIASDGNRPREVRLHAIAGLGVLARGRLVGLYDASESVRVSIDVAVPARTLAQVRACLEVLATDKDGEVAKRARAARGG